ncbi:uncharacterized protein [Garra rufa]|uniref:uncharacterized protein n=1 Tax=Garra rufa TaxID=137080 RepID=UPI003CCE5ED8
MDKAAIKALGPRQNVGELEAKVLPRAAASKIVLVKEEECELKEIWVADTTGEIKLTLWDSLIPQVHVSKSYSFSILAKRHIQGDIILTATTPSTQVMEITALDVPDGDSEDPENGASSTTLHGLVSGFKSEPDIAARGATVFKTTFLLTPITHRCSVCNLLQRSSVYRSTYGGTIVFTADQQDHSLTVTDCCLIAFLAIYVYSRLYTERGGNH